MQNRYKRLKNSFDRYDKRDQLRYGVEEEVREKEDSLLICRGTHDDANARRGAEMRVAEELDNEQQPIWR